MQGSKVPAAAGGDEVGHVLPQSSKARSARPVSPRTPVLRKLLFGFLLLACVAAGAFARQRALRRGAIDEFGRNSSLILSLTASNAASLLRDWTGGSQILV